MIDGTGGNQGAAQKELKEPVSLAVDVAELGPALLTGSGNSADFAPKQVRYIKLGKGGAWSKVAFEKGIIPFDCYQIDHRICAAGDWAKARADLAAAGVRATGDAIRELQDFYDLPCDTLWFSIADGRLHWTFAAGEVQTASQSIKGLPNRWRATRDGWHSESLTGEALMVAGLSSALTKVASYQKTICTTAQAEYLLRRVRGDQDPLFARAQELKAENSSVALQMIRRLPPDEFEILIDLIFSRSGWRRISALGGNQPDVDLLLEQPLTGETAWVQVKSSCSQSVVDDYLDRFKKHGSKGHFFFAVHTPTETLRLPESPRLLLLNADRLAEAALDAGLFDWLAQRIR